MKKMWTRPELIDLCADMTEKSSNGHGKGQDKTPPGNAWGIYKNGIIPPPPVVEPS